MEMHSGIMELHTYKSRMPVKTLLQIFYCFVMRETSCCLFSDHNQADIVEAFNSTSRYLDDLLNIDTPYFEQMVGQIYPTKLQ